MHRFFKRIFSSTSADMPNDSETQAENDNDDITKALASSINGAKFKYLADVVRHLGEAIPNKEIKGNHLHRLVAETISGGSPMFLDLGCGSGRSAIDFREINKNIKWVGVDIVERMPIEGVSIRLYDGVNLPFGEGSFDVVYSKQVFEHVRHPEPLLREVTRVLKPGGHFMGRVSCMEPFHLDSIFGYTAYGWKVITEDAGLRLRSIAAASDAFSLIHWHMARSKHIPFAGRTQRLRRAMSMTHAGVDWRRRNAAELLFAGNFVFHCTKPE